MYLSTLVLKYLATLIRREVIRSTVWTEMGKPTAYLWPTSDRILVSCSSATSRDHMPDEVRCWQAKRRN